MAGDCAKRKRKGEGKIPGGAERRGKKRRPRFKRKRRENVNCPGESTVKGGGEREDVGTESKRKTREFHSHFAKGKRGEG